MTKRNERMLDGVFFSRRKATEDTKRKISAWEIWECTDPEFTYTYDKTVSLYVQDGAADITFENGEKVNLVAGDFLTIQSGTSATWAITQPIRNCYQYHDSFQSASNRHKQVYGS